MKKVYCNILFFCLIFSFFTGCSSLNEEKDKGIVAQVNKYKMTVEDLRYELAHMPYDSTDLLKTEEGIKEFIDRLLEKEILLQEAQHLGLDREKDFMKSIENYWEQALLKLLLDRKSREISGSIHVYDNEIEEYYRDSGEGLPFSKVKDEMKRAIRQKKETKAMDAWIEELREKANIKINKELLEGVLSQ